jgi:hypothetical protein
MKNISMITLSIVALLSYSATSYSVVGYEKGNTGGEMHIMGGEGAENNMMDHDGYEKGAPTRAARAVDLVGPGGQLRAFKVEGPEGEIRALEGEMHALDGSAQAEMRALYEGRGQGQDGEMYTMDAQ